MIEGWRPVDLLRAGKECTDHLAHDLSEEHGRHARVDLRLELELQRVVEQAAVLRQVRGCRAEPPRRVEDVEYAAFGADGLNNSGTIR